MDMFKRHLIYIQVHRGHLIAKRLGTDRVVRKDCAGLDHPRTLMGDFQQIQGALSTAYKELGPFVSILKPRALIHLLPPCEGGYTDVEMRAFKEASEMAGITCNFMSTISRPLTNAEMAKAL